MTLEELLLQSTPEVINSRQPSIEEIAEREDADAAAVEMRATLPGAPPITEIDFNAIKRDGFTPQMNPETQQYDIPEMYQLPQPIPSATVVERERMRDELSELFEAPTVSAEEAWDYVSNVGSAVGQGVRNAAQEYMDMFYEGIVQSTMEAGLPPPSFGMDGMIQQPVGEMGAWYAAQAREMKGPELSDVPGYTPGESMFADLVVPLSQFAVGYMGPGGAAKGVAKGSGALARFGEESLRSAVSASLSFDPEQGNLSTYARSSPNISGVLNEIGITDEDLALLDSTEGGSEFEQRLKLAVEDGLLGGAIAGAISGLKHSPKAIKAIADGIMDSINEVGVGPIRAQLGVIGKDVSGVPTGGYKPAEKLSDQGRAAEEAFGKKLIDADAARLEYEALPETDGGRVLSTDIAREMSPEYRADRTRSADIHEPASAFIKQLYKMNLAEMEKGDTVVFTAGGTGAGKTSGLDMYADELDDAGLIYDTNLAGYASSKSKIQAALDAGMKVKIFYVDRSPLAALDTMAERSYKPDLPGGGRTVPIAEHLKTHVESRQTVKRLYDEYGDHPYVRFAAVKNEGKRGEAVPIAVESVDEISDTDILKEALNERLKALYETEKRIDARSYRGIAGETAGEGVPGGSGEVRPSAEGIPGEPQLHGTAKTPGVVPGRTVSTRIVKPVTEKQFAKGQTRPGAGDITSLRSGLAATKAAGPAFERNIASLDEHATSFKVDSALPTEARADQYVRGFADNLIWLHDRMPPAVRARAGKWYVGGNKLAQDMSKKAGSSLEQSAAVLASQSPQRDWYMNVSLAQRIHDGVAVARATDWAATPEMRKWAKDYAGRQAGIRNNDIRKRLKAGKLTEEEAAEQTADSEARMAKERRHFTRVFNSTPKTTVEKGMWIRAWDEATNPRSYNEVSPEGELLDPILSADGEPSKIQWGSSATIGKGVSILEDGSFRNVSKQLGNEHKVRNFYNNIANPDDPTNVTVDTHQVAASHLRPYSGSSLPVLQNFGGRGSASSVETGANGTYGIYQDAVTLAAQERGISPREMQSITWEGVRGLFPDTLKSPAFDKKIEAIWLQVQEGTLSREAALEEILRLAGGINEPSWSKTGG